MRTLSGARLKEARQRAGVPRDRLALAVGRSSTTIRDWEQGRQAPAFVVLELVAAEIGCDVDDLLVEVQQ